MEEIAILQETNARETKLRSDEVVIFDGPVREQTLEIVTQLQINAVVACDLFE